MRTKISSHYIHDPRHFYFVRQSGIQRGELDDGKPIVSDLVVLICTVICGIAAVGVFFLWGNLA